MVFNFLYGHSDFKEGFVLPAILFAPLRLPGASRHRHPTPNGADAKSSNSSDRSMVLVRGGTIQMGIDAIDVPRFEDLFGVHVQELFQEEVPKHGVTVDDFYIDRNLVTNAQFKRLTDANTEWQQGYIPAKLDNVNYLKHWTTPTAPASSAEHPVVNVNWYAAVAYCRWSGKHLPSEPEWEYAARGGLDAVFPWGNEPADSTRANFGGGLGTTSHVGAYPANQYGLFDVAGNVWQYLVDEWKQYPATPQKNPVGGGNRFLGGKTFLQVKTRRVFEAAVLMERR